MKKIINTIIFWSAIWGLTEATLGYVLHMFPIGAGWLIWFPLAFYFMNTVYRKTKKPYSVLFTSLISALIKLIDLLLPARIDKIINPAVSILLEGIIMFAVILTAEQNQTFLGNRLAKVFTISFGWRVLYTIYILLMPPFFFSVSSLRSSELFFRFIFIESIAGSLIIYLFIKCADLIRGRVKTESRKETGRLGHVFSVILANDILVTAFSTILLALAVYIQFVL